MAACCVPASGEAILPLPFSRLAAASGEPFKTHSRPPHTVSLLINQAKRVAGETLTSPSLYNNAIILILLYLKLVEFVNVVGIEGTQYGRVGLSRERAGVERIVWRFVRAERERGERC